MRERILGTSRSCDGVTRREVLRVGSLSALGLTLPDLREVSAGGSRAGLDTSRGEVSCILLWLHGGISHLDSFDPKPEAPVEVRGEFGVIGTRVPGILLCDRLPRLAEHQDKYSILRSLNPHNGSHGVADATMLSGHPFNPALTYPAFGAVIARERGHRNGMSPNVQIGTAIDQQLGGGTAGFLGDPFNPLILPGTNASNPVLASPARKAFDIHAEDPTIRDRYGRNSLGEGCLLARRLIEAGVRFVTVTDGGWDTHQNNFLALTNRLLPRLDIALSSLLQDLADRGLLSTTLVVTLSDFGRTPKINPSAGRDHWATASIALFAGGGIQPGIVVGQTNPLGEYPTEAPYDPEDVAATLYHCLGIPLNTLHQTPAGCPVQVNPKGRVIRELV